MGAWDDEEDWTGEPPEGRHARSRAKPEFWENHWQEAAAGAVLGVFMLIALLIAVLS